MSLFSQYKALGDSVASIVEEMRELRRQQDALIALCQSAGVKDWVIRAALTGRDPNEPPRAAMGEH